MTWSQFDALRWVLKHPLNRGRQGRALMRWAGTQMRSHIFGHVRAVPFIDDVRLYIGPGLTVPNMQHFAGLGEMDVMGFLMHFLRPDDVFVDVGANVGVISVLGAGIAGARTIAVEPDPQAFKWLRRHAELNGLDGRIATEEAALGEINGTISLSDDRGAANRVALPGDGSSQSVRCLPLDELLADEKPNVIKIDVEGYELPVLRGARNTLRQQELAAVIVE
ncbi:MAG: FkbM family methyltransferase, partial [Rickettsiales bacterium]